MHNFMSTMLIFLPGEDTQGYISFLKFNTYVDISIFLLKLQLKVEYLLQI